MVSLKLVAHIEIAISISSRNQKNHKRDKREVKEKIRQCKWDMSYNLEENMPNNLNLKHQEAKKEL